MLYNLEHNLLILNYTEIKMVRKCRVYFFY